MRNSPKTKPVNALIMDFPASIRNQFVFMNALISGILLQQEQGENLVVIEARSLGVSRKSNGQQALLRVVLCVKQAHLD